MENPTKGYTNDDIDLLIGKIKGTKYAKPVQAILKKWKKPMEIVYIHRCVNRQFYSEVIWDAVVEYLSEQNEKRANKSARVREVVGVAPNVLNNNR